MSDGEKLDFLWECGACSGKRKRTRRSKLSCENDTAMKAEENQKKRKKKSSKCNDTAMKAEENQEKRKKKSSKCKDATTRGIFKKDKKKEKKKKKKTVGEQLAGAVLTQASVPVESPVAQMEPPAAYSSHNLQPDPVARPSKKKKRVEFDLSPCAVRIKRPKLPASSPLCPTKSILLKSGGDQGQTQDNDSQSNSQDINSQDLFITQKTFRAPSPEASSGETSDTDSVAIPPPFTLWGLSLLPQGRPERPQVYRRASKPKKKVGEEPDKQKNEETVTQTTRIGSTLPKEVESSSPVCKISSSRSPGVQSWVVPPSPQAVESKKLFYVVSRKTLTSTSTQTENFFTAELSSYRRFCRRQGAGADAESPKPLDLTLPHRARRAACASRGEAGRKSEMTLSLQSDSELKSAETTSGEDNEPPGRLGGGKLELAQVKAVQTRLNECFFFKTKGTRQSPRPESPLMRLDLARGVTTRK
ncbi:uncharacterized protein LOC142899305 [Nelusetta ayraudi]|uniref:uncharacterized protein LOC142899305 n=1 Tax=Nelusetta ayraudi TaxID=303726 RepID=UPI003F6F4A9D